MITVWVELIVLIFFVIWYFQNKEIEPLIGIIVTFGAFTTSVILKFSKRPRIALHYNKTHWGRSPKGYTSNNPPIIRVGIDNPEQYWELDWNYELEIRNNSNLTAYDIRIEYINLPPKTFVKGEIGKIEPIQPHENKIFKIRFNQNVTGNHLDADKYLKENESKLTDKLVIKVSYKDDASIKYRTKFLWKSDENKYSVF